MIAIWRAPKEPHLLTKGLLIFRLKISTNPWALALISALSFLFSFCNVSGYLANFCSTDIKVCINSLWNLTSTVFTLKNFLKIISLLLLILGCNQGPHRASRLNLDEQRTQVCKSYLTQVVLNILIALCWFCLFSLHRLHCGQWPNLLLCLEEMWETLMSQHSIWSLILPCWK